MLTFTFHIFTYMLPSLHFTFHNNIILQSGFLSLIKLCCCKETTALVYLYTLSYLCKLLKQQLLICTPL